MPRAIKTHCGGTWSRARYFSFIRSALRRAFTRYPVNYQVRAKARRPYRGTNKQQKWEYQCAICKKMFMQKDICLDHITPCGSLNSYDDLPRFVSTLFCEADNLQVACKRCHKDKTNEERKPRATRKGKERAADD